MAGTAFSSPLSKPRFLLPTLHRTCSTKFPTQTPPPDLLSLPPPLSVATLSSTLHSLSRLRPRSLASPYLSSILSSFLSSSLSNPNFPSSTLPLSLAVLQTLIRSGLPPPDTAKVPLAQLWAHVSRRHHRIPVCQVINGARFGYRLDLNVCNFLISAVCEGCEIDEAVRVLKGIRAAGCLPDSESYTLVIEAAFKDGRVELGEELVRIMVVKEGILLRRGMVWRVVEAMRKAGEVRRAVEVVRFLEREGCGVGFEVYEALAEGCLERREFVMAGKVVVEMARKGFIPHVKVRLKVVDGLARIGQHELSSAVRQELADIGS